MSDIPTTACLLPPPADQWLLPLSDEQACGENLEYDPESLELDLATGKPESQFGPGEPPDWGRVRDLAESLFRRTRDLRFALWWGRAKVNLDGFFAVPAALALLDGLLDRFWDQLHPVPDADDPDALARLSVIGGLNKLDSLLGDIRSARLADDRELLGLRIRDVEVALGKLPRRSDEPARTQAELVGILAQTPDTSAALRVKAEAALASLQSIQSTLAQRFSPDLMVDLATLRGMLTGLEAVLPARVDVAESAPDSHQAPQAVHAPSRQAGGVHSVENRQEAIRAIELVCAYLERSEPTNPAQLLLRRAARVINKDFLQLVRELAPDAVADVARIMGVDPDTISDQN